MADNFEEQKKIEYTDTEKKFYEKICREMEYAKIQRDQPHDEFDGQTYPEYYESNAKSANSYIPPKVNEQDVRTTTGVTKEKNNTLLASLLNLNLEADITAFDKYDNVINELGETMEDMIGKSKKIEKPDYEMKRAMIYNEYLAQGSVAVEDTIMEYKIPEKTQKGLKWKKNGEKAYKECSYDLICGLDLYFGNIKQPFIELQPYLFRRKLLTWAEAKAKYGNWERFKFVPKNGAIDRGEDGRSFNNWVCVETKDGLVEELKYMCKWSNDYMVMLNGVMMFEVTEDGTMPLSAINGKCEYPIAYSICEYITNFAYGKSIPAKTKVDQAIFDESTRMAVLMNRKMFMPPLANSSTVQLTKKIFFPATIVDGVKADQIQEIGRNDGMTVSAYNFMTFWKQLIDNKSVSPVFEGQQSKGSQTATEISALRQQSMMKLGVTILGIILLEKKMSWLRLFNVLKNWTEPVYSEVKEVIGKLKENKVYKSISMDSTNENGRKSKRIVRFQKENLPSTEQIYAEEELLTKVKREPHRVMYLDPELLKSIELTWFIEVTPVPKETTELRKAMFMDNIKEGLALFGPQSFNLDYLKERWAVMSNENPDKLLAKTQTNIPADISMNSPHEAGLVQNQMLPKPMPQPSVNTLAGA